MQNMDLAIVDFDEAIEFVEGSMSVSTGSQIFEMWTEHGLVILRESLQSCLEAAELLRQLVAECVSPNLLVASTDQAVPRSTASLDHPCIA